MDKIFKSQAEAIAWRRQLIVNAIRNNFVSDGMTYDPAQQTMQQELPQKGNGDNVSSMDKFAQQFSEFLKNYNSNNTETKDKGFFDWSADTVAGYDDKWRKEQEDLRAGKLKLNRIEVGVDRNGNPLSDDQRNKAIALITKHGMTHDNYYSKDEYKNFVDDLYANNLDLNIETYTPENAIKNIRRDNIKDYMLGALDMLRMPEHTYERTPDRNNYFTQNIGDSQFAANMNEPDAFERNMNKPFILS